MEAEIHAEIDELRRRLNALTQRVSVRRSTEDLPAGPLSLLRCRAGEDPVALLVEQLDEVVPMARLTPVPEAPPWVLGLLNLRGKTVTVLDVYARTHRRERRSLLTDMIVICRVGDRRVGLALAAVETLTSVDHDQLEPPPRDVPWAPYVHGLVTLGDRPVFLLSIPRLVEASELPEGIE